MSQYSEQDLKFAAEFREGIHREALEIIRKTRPGVTEVIDRHPVEDYFQEHWDYPGKWYTIVAIPYGYGSRKALVNTIVRDTLTGSVPAEGSKTPAADGIEAQRAAWMEQGRRRLNKQLDAKPSGYRELFVVEVDQRNRSFRAVGVDAAGRYILEHCEEYRLGSATSSADAYYALTDGEYKRYARLALINGQLTQERYDKFVMPPVQAARQDDDPFYALIADYPDCVVDYCIIKPTARYLGYESHRAALKEAWQTLFVPDEDGENWQGNPNLATGKQISADALFSLNDQEGKLNYRRAFLYTPHENGYTGKDFTRVNAALFPNGTNRLEVYEWTTDWSEYFNAGHEWWGALCLTVFDKSLDRFVVMMASATD